MGNDIARRPWCKAMQLTRMRSFFSSVFLSLCSNERKSQLRLERQQKISTMNPIAKKHFQVISPPPDQTEASCPSLQ